MSEKYIDIGETIEDEVVASNQELDELVGTLVERLSSDDLENTERAEISPETLKRNQAMYDFLDIRDDSGNPIDLQKQYEAGNIQGLSKEQQKAIEEMPEEERLSEILIIPGHILREEIIKKINDKYKEKFGQDIYYSDAAKEDIDNTSSVTKNPRPNTFYTIALHPKQETVAAHPEMMNKTLQEQLNELKKKQKENPNLNLRGLTLQEAMLFDALICANSENQADHADNWARKYSYNLCLEEVTRDKDGNPLRALRLFWDSGDSRLLLHSHPFPSSAVGARLGAVFPIDIFHLSIYQEKLALLEIKKVFGKDVSQNCKQVGDWQKAYYLLTQKVEESGKSLLDMIADLPQKERQKYAVKIFAKQMLLRPAERPDDEANTLLRPAEGGGSSVPDEHLLRTVENEPEEESLN